MNIKIKITIITLISTILIFSLPICSNAFSIDDIFGGAKNFIAAGNNGSGNVPKETDLVSISKTVSGVLLTIAVAVTFISIAVMGVNFAVQTVEDKAKIKEAMVPWIIGVFISFGAYGIWKFVMNIFYGLNL